MAREPIVVDRPTPGLGGGALHLRKHAELMATTDNMSAPPDHFNPTKHYLVRLSRPVPAVKGDDSHMLRPSQVIQVNGDFAEANRDAIVSARVLEG